MKSNGKKIMLTCYDASFARILADVRDLDFILVGDSLGMVIGGEPTTTTVSIDQILYHTKAVREGMKKSSAEKAPLLMSDMPIHSYDTSALALENAQKILNSGADAVKVEGPVYEIVRSLKAAKIKVCAHIGLTPQTIQDYKVQGRTEKEADRLFEEAMKLEEAGADWIVLEMIPASLAKRITENLKILTVGIGAGPDCGAQVLVLYDLLGLNPDFSPKFLKKYIPGYDVVLKAVEHYVRDVKAREYPLEEHSFR